MMEQTLYNLQCQYYVEDAIWFTLKASTFLRTNTLRNGCVYWNTVAIRVKLPFRVVHSKSILYEYRTQQEFLLLCWAAPRHLTELMSYDIDTERIDGFRATHRVMYRRGSVEHSEDRPLTTHSVQRLTIL